MDDLFAEESTLLWRQWSKLTSGGRKHLLRPRVLWGGLLPSRMVHPNASEVIWWFPKKGISKMDGLQWKILLKWMIWGYPNFRTPPWFWSTLVVHLFFLSRCKPFAPCKPKTPGLLSFTLRPIFSAAIRSWDTIPSGRSLRPDTDSRLSILGDLEGCSLGKAFPRFSQLKKLKN